MKVKKHQEIIHNQTHALLTPTHTHAMSTLKTYIARRLTNKSAPAILAFAISTVEQQQKNRKVTAAVVKEYMTTWEKDLKTWLKRCEKDDVDVDAIVEQIVALCKGDLKDVAAKLGKKLKVDKVAKKAAPKEKKGEEKAAKKAAPKKSEGKKTAKKEESDEEEEEESEEDNGEVDEKAVDKAIRQATQEKGDDECEVALDAWKDLSEAMVVRRVSAVVRNAIKFAKKNGSSVSRSDIRTYINATRRADEYITNSFCHYFSDNEELIDKVEKVVAKMFDEKAVAPKKKAAPKKAEEKKAVAPKKKAAPKKEEAEEEEAEEDEEQVSDVESDDE